jgi:hypothetical protein
MTIVIMILKTANTVSKTIGIMITSITIIIIITTTHIITGITGAMAPQQHCNRRQRRCLRS